MSGSGFQDGKANGDTRFPLDSFASNPSNEPQVLESEQILHNSFKAAAVSITQLYRESQKLRNQCLVEGYEQCLRDIWTCSAALAQKRSGDQSYCGLNSNSKPTVEVTALLAALTKRLALLQSPKFQPDREQHQQRRADSFGQQSRNTAGHTTDPAQRLRSMNGDQMDVNGPESAHSFSVQTESKFGQGKYSPNEDSNQDYQTKKRRIVNSVEMQSDPIQPKFNRQYAFVGNRNSHLFQDPFQMRAGNDWHLDP